VKEKITTGGKKGPRKEGKSSLARSDPKEFLKESLMIYLFVLEGGGRGGIGKWPLRRVRNGRRKKIPLLGEKGKGYSLLAQ